MLEEVIDAVFFHQSADEIEVCLAVLDAIFERRRRTGGGVAEIGEAAVGKDLLDDRQRRHAGEDAAVRGPGQEPQPGAQHELIDVEVLVGSRPARLRHQPMEIARLAVLRLELDGRAEPEERREIEIGLVAHRLDAEFEHLAQSFDRIEPRQRQGVRAERRRELALAFVLGEGSGHRVLAADSCSSDGDHKGILGRVDGEAGAEAGRSRGCRPRCSSAADWIVSVAFGAASSCPRASVATAALNLPGWNLAQGRRTTTGVGEPGGWALW